MKKNYINTAFSAACGCFICRLCTQDTSPAPTNTAPLTQRQTSQEPTTGKVKTGLAIITSIASSKDAGEADGLAQADSLIAAVIVDSNGKIVVAAL